MKSCKNCLHRHQIMLCKCFNRDHWEHDSEPSVCDGCYHFGKYEINKRACHHCVDGSKWVSPEVYRAHHKYLEGGNAES